MAEPEREGERPREERTPPQSSRQHDAEGHLGPVDQSPTSYLDKDIFEKLRETPRGMDPAFYPLHVLQDLYFYIRFRDQNPGARAKAIGEQYAPIEEPLRKVIKAYSILAYPHIQDWWLQDQIEADLESDRQAYGRDDIELSDMELRALGRLAATRNLPFDPEKRRYEYGEVPIQPHVDPYGLRHLTTEEIRQMQEAEEE